MIEFETKFSTILTLMSLNYKLKVPL